MLPSGGVLEGRSNVQLDALDFTISVRPHVEQTL